MPGFYHPSALLIFSPYFIIIIKEYDPWSYAEAIVWKKKILNVHHLNNVIVTCWDDIH